MSSDNGKTFQVEAVNQMVRLTIHLERGRKGRRREEEREKGKGWKGEERGDIHKNKKPNDIAAAYTHLMMTNTKTQSLLRGSVDRNNNFATVIIIFSG